MAALVIIAGDAVALRQGWAAGGLAVGEAVGLTDARCPGSRALTKGGATGFNGI